MKKKFDPDGKAAVIDDKGHVQATFHGPFAESEARTHLKQCGSVVHLRGATIVTGERAAKALDWERL